MSEVKYSGPVTPEEIDEVFGWVLTRPDCLVIERVPPKEQVGSIIIPDRQRLLRQTGSSFGTVIQIGREAEENLNNRLSAANRKIKVGDWLSFSIAAPLPIGFLDSSGLPMLPGFDTSRYACVELLQWNDVVGHVPKEKIK